MPVNRTNNDGIGPLIELLNVRDRKLGVERGYQEAKVSITFSRSAFQEGAKGAEVVTIHCRDTKECLPALAPVWYIDLGLTSSSTGCP